MLQINSLTDVKNFVETIPAEKFTQFIRRNSNGQCCVLGHMDEAMYGETSGFYVYNNSNDCVQTLKQFMSDQQIADMVHANNWTTDSKQGVLDYLNNTIIAEV